MRLLYFLVPLAGLFGASQVLDGVGRGPVGAAVQSVLNPPIQVRLSAFSGTEPIPVVLRGDWVLRRADGHVLSEGTQFEGVLAVDQVGARLGSFRPGVETFRIETAGDAAIRLGDRWYRGGLLVELVRAEETSLPQALELRLELPLEDYVLGVVSGEMPTSSRGASAALRAQAVAARTYALFRLRQGRTFLHDDTRDQRFLGVDFETGAAAQAVQDTASQVLFWDGDLVPAYYHASCGGHTANAAAAGFAASELPPLKGVPDEGCRDAYSWWEHTVPPGALDRLARQHDLGDWLKAIEVVEGDPAGRCLRARVDGAFASAVLRGEDLRPAIQTPSAVWKELQSRADGALVVRGTGRGHGVGLCQEGALRRSRQQDDHLAILSHYYPGADVRSLADLP